jgi:hypothetical protein
MVQKLRIGLVAAVMAVAGVVAVVYPTAAIAHDGEHDSTNAHDAADRQSAAKQRAAGKLDEARKKVCNNRSTAIKKVMTIGADAAQRHLNFFGKSVERIQQFYTNKNLNVANYDQLVASVNAKKEAVQGALASLKAVPGFDCNSDNPVGNVDDYKAKLAAVRNALKDYRSAITALLVAVKTAAQTAEGS